MSVHPEFLKKQKLPSDLVTKDVSKERYADICAVKRYLTRNGIVIRKFLLHVSKKKQKKRFLERLEKNRRNNGNSPMPMFRNGSSGTSTWKLMKI